jgi:hypothetical protein
MCSLIADKTLRAIHVASNKHGAARHNSPNNSKSNVGMAAFRDRRLPPIGDSKSNSNDSKNSKSNNSPDNRKSNVGVAAFRDRRLPPIGEPLAITPSRWQ